SADCRGRRSGGRAHLDARGVGFRPSAPRPLRGPRLRPEGRALRRPHRRALPMTERALRVVLAEDSVLLREGVARLLEDAGCEVVELMAEGRSNKAIAERLVVTERAVEKHVTNIFGKLHLAAAPKDHRRVLAVLAFLDS